MNQDRSARQLQKINASATALEHPANGAKTDAVLGSITPVVVQAKGDTAQYNGNSAWLDVCRECRTANGAMAILEEAKKPKVVAEPAEETTVYTTLFLFAALVVGAATIMSR